jgi:hypothetical protein
METEIGNGGTKNVLLQLREVGIVNSAEIISDDINYLATMALCLASLSLVRN